MSKVPLQYTDTDSHIFSCKTYDTGESLKSLQQKHIGFVLIV